MIFAELDVGVEFGGEIRKPGSRREVFRVPEDRSTHSSEGRGGQTDQQRVETQFRVFARAVHRLEWCSLAVLHHQGFQTQQGGFEGHGAGGGTVFCSVVLGVWIIDAVEGHGGLGVVTDHTVASGPQAVRHWLQRGRGGRQIEVVGGATLAGETADKRKDRRVLCAAAKLDASSRRSVASLKGRNGSSEKKRKNCSTFFSERNIEASVAQSASAFGC